MSHHYLACDLGAESGRLMLGTLTTDRLQMEELHRFPNTPLQQDGTMTWDLNQLLRELQSGLDLAADRDVDVSGISTDSWGVDYVLIAPDGSLMTPAFHYRDSRSDSGVNAAHAKVPRETLFEHTGIQFMPFNTVYQLMAETPERLQRATNCLGIGDAFNYHLSGVAAAEVSFASTTQLYNPNSNQWDTELMDRLGLPADIFPRIVPSGSLLGPIRPELCRTPRLRSAEVIATCSHDTGAAVAAVPATGGHWAYVSSGTWSLMGVELPRPVINDTCRSLNYTNEIGHGNTIRLLKNIVGLWIVQECRRHWEAEGTRYDYSVLTSLAGEAPPFRSLVNPADPRFLLPGEMPSKIVDFCRETDQAAPSTPGMFVRTVLESLALFYQLHLEQLEMLTARRIDRLHVVGGGSKNALLNQFTANATQVPVLAGPAEATAAGNVLIQAIALGQLPSLQAARQLVARSNRIETFTPNSDAGWSSARERFRRLLT